MDGLEGLEKVSMDSSTSPPSTRGELGTNENEKEPAYWINNQGEAVDQVFGFNANAELVNGRAAMVGFLMMIVMGMFVGIILSVLQETMLIILRAQLITLQVQLFSMVLL